MPLEISIPVLPAPRGGEPLIRKLFEPLGYQLTIKRHQNDVQFPEWGESKYYAVTLNNTVTVEQMLSHLYVLIPVLDNEKHYYISKNEIGKLIRQGKEWLSGHPEKEQITERYLQFRSLSSKALQVMSEEESEDQQVQEAEDTATKERKVTLHQQRLQAVAELLKASGAKTVLDLGCGEGKLLRILLKEKQFEKIAGMDVSYRELLKVKSRLRWEKLAPRQRERIQLFQGSLTYRDQRLAGFDAAAVVEVIEHLDANRLQAFEKVLFKYAQPKKVVLTTPNREYNVLYEGLPADRFRHSDHRFEWTRNEFQSWANATAQQYNYTVEFYPIGEVDEQHGASSQMAVFSYGN